MSSNSTTNSTSSSLSDSSTTTTTSITSSSQTSTSSSSDTTTTSSSSQSSSSSSTTPPPSTSATSTNGGGNGGGNTSNGGGGGNSSNGGGGGGNGASSTGGGSGPGSSGAPSSGGSSSGSATGASSESGPTAATTLSTPVGLITTNSNGQTITSTPTQFTSVMTVSGSDGLSTTTVIVANPSLSPNDNNANGGNGSKFFANKGAVAGVFVVVGLAAASILIWALFFAHRRRQKQRLENEATLSSALAAAGYARNGWEDEDEPEMAQRSRVTSFGLNSHPDPFATPTLAPTTPGGDFDPYQDYTEEYGPAGAAAGLGATAHAATPSRGPADEQQPVRVLNPQERSEYMTHRSQQHSEGSYEPLLAAAGISEANSSQASPTEPMMSTGNGKPPTPPPRDPRRLRSPPATPMSTDGSGSGAGSTEESGIRGAGRPDDRIDSRLMGEGEEPRDDTDYSRRVV